MTHSFRFRGLGFATLLAALAWANFAAAINVKIDYSLDTDGFFGAGNPQGAQAGAKAKAAMDAAAQFYSGILEDSFDGITVPQNFSGSKGGQATWFWKERYLNPQTGLNNAAPNVNVSANDFVVFVGARDLPGAELGLGGPGGFAGGFFTQTGEFTQAEKDQLAAMKTAFSNASTNRGETSGFGRWGGSIAFDKSANWNFDHTINPPALTFDFYSVALHELAHTFGFGASDEWTALVKTVGDKTYFTGAHVKTTVGDTKGAELDAGSGAGAQDSGAHWLQSISQSPIYEGSGNDLPRMVPKTDAGIRRLLTNLDAAALADLGWEIDLPTGASSLTAENFASGSASATLVSSGLTLTAVPEPTSAALASLAGLALLFGKRRRR